MNKAAFAALALLLGGASLPAMAQEGVNPFDMSFAENLEVPQLSAKGLKDIKTHILELQSSLASHGIDAVLERGDEVVLATIPCSKLFAPNDTELKPSGKKLLGLFHSLVKHPTMYKLVVAVHADNSGDAQYADSLTEERADAVENFLTDIPDRPAVCNVVPYGLGQEDSIADNGSMKGRASNRRVEIFIIPEWQMEQMARSGKMKKK